MLVILIIVCAMVFFFCIFTIILHGIAKDKLKVEERIKDFVLEEKEERKKTTTKKKRLKVKKNTGFKTRKELAQIENELYNVGIQIPVQQFIVIWISASIMVPIILVIVGVSSVICIALVALIAFFPMIYVRGKKKKRKNRLEGQLIEAIGVLSNALKAGHSFQSAMSNIATDMEAKP